MSQSDGGSPSDDSQGPPPSIEYPPDLPIVGRRPELLEVIGQHQVVIVAGETGSGKSTQLPKLCLELGRGSAGMIGHTQPRRLAARAVCERIAFELDVPVGSTVGYAVRFTDQVGPETRLKLMTDGILLAEIQRDPTLSRYDTLIIDEAHERTLNVDFLLGYLHQLLPRRRDLKLIITSATIDTDKFADHFGQAPVVEVSGRSYPVEVRYRPLDGSDGRATRDQVTGICDAVRELTSEGAGDILVFLSGERDIRDAKGALEELDLPDTELFPLYARLSAAEQHRVFRGHRGRRIVLATNVAETSVTVPGIRAVVDPGLARISRYSQRTKVQRLPIEPISKASADQRMGRCGRLGPGVCIRLYSEDDFDSRPDFTEPEIQRSNLASVILRMASLGLGTGADRGPGPEMVAAFPFVDRPDRRSINDGVALLEELAAVDPQHAGAADWLTSIGRQLASIPIDPRLARMLIEADSNDCLRELLVIAAAISIQDPRERPTENRAAADQLHRRFDHPTSDFLGQLELWDYLVEQRRQRSSNQFRRLCLREYLHHNRIREWFELRRQLQQVARDLGMRPNRRPAEPDAIHRAVLAGLLSHAGWLEPQSSGDARSPSGRRRRRTYRGARGARFSIAPGSGLESSPEWVMAAEIVETAQLYARTVAGIQPEWLEELGRHVATVAHGQPWWDPDRAMAVTSERVTLYGLPVVNDRTVSYNRVDHDDARRLFIEHALVDGDWDRTYPFLGQNRRVIDATLDLESRFRRHDLLVDRSSLVEFYDRRIGVDVVSARAFDRWWRRTEQDNPELLAMAEDDVRNPGVELDLSGAPDHWDIGSLRLPVRYEFDPESPVDGLTVDVPLASLNELSADHLSWHVPAHRRELVEALVRTLPKDVRRALIPIADSVDDLVAALDPGTGSLSAQLCDLVSRRTGRLVTETDLDPARLAPHLVPTLRVVDGDGAMLAAGKNLVSLRRRLDKRIRSELAAARHPVTASGLVTWDDRDELPRTVTVDSNGRGVTAHPALVDHRTSVAVELLPTAADQQEAMWAGTRRLLRLQLRRPLRELDRRLDAEASRVLAASMIQTKGDWYDDIVDAVIDDVLVTHGGPAWSRSEFAALVEGLEREFPACLDRGIGAAIEIETRTRRINAELTDVATVSAFSDIVADVAAHRDRLLYPGILVAIGLPRVPDVVRYLDGISYRLDRVRRDPRRDRVVMAELAPIERSYRSAMLDEPSPELEDIGWMLEELRVSRFAQPVGAAVKVSEQRVRSALDEARG